MSGDVTPAGRPRRRRGVAMPLLFLVLTSGFVAIAVFALLANQWIFFGVGVALASWMATFIGHALRPRRG